MLVPFKIALRYLFSKKTINLINIIAGISAFGVLIASAALIIILSVFNGLEDILIKQFNTFDPELRIDLKEGRYFEINDSLKQILNEEKNIKTYSFSIEDKVVVQYDKITHPFYIKGVDANFTKVNHLDSAIIDGKFSLYQQKNDWAVVGDEVSDKLSIKIAFVTPIILYAPTRKNTVQAADAFNKKYIYPSGIYSVDPSVDNKIVVRLSFAQDILEAKNKATLIAISLKNKALIQKTQKNLRKKLGTQFYVKNRREQNSFYRVINSERLMIYLILGFVLLIASFNIAATLSMLILDKKSDFVTFQSLGLNNFQIEMIFLFEAWLTTVLGALVGLLIGGVLVFLQKEYAWVSLANDGFNNMPYPVDIVAFDFVKIGLLIILVSILTSIIPIRILSKKYL